MNYRETFILVAADCPAKEGLVPAVKEGRARSIAAIQFELISRNPYEFTQEDIQFMVFAERNAVPPGDNEARERFFQKSHPCLRTSPLPKKYGWGIHFDVLGRAALYSVNSVEYDTFVAGENEIVTLIPAMRNKKN